MNLDALAREAGYSRFHFARSFRATYGLTPRVYLSARRVERARELLRSANLTVTEICHLVGFSSLGSFSARYKGAIGLSPSEYRAREIARGGPPPIPGCFVLMWSTPSPQSRRSAARQNIGRTGSRPCSATTLETGSASPSGRARRSYSENNEVTIANASPAATTACVCRRSGVIPGLVTQTNPAMTATPKYARR